MLNRIKRNKEEYNRLCSDSNYSDVVFNPDSGGLKATHIKHNFDKNKGWYERAAQDAGFNRGYSVILEEEPQNLYMKKSCEGFWNGLSFEVAGAETATANNVRNALKHCATKPNAEVAVVVFPNNNYSAENFQKGFAKFNGLIGTSQYKLFKLIYCIQNGTIIHIEKPS